MKRIAIAVCVVVLVFAVAAWAQTPGQPLVELNHVYVTLQKDTIDSIAKSAFISEQFSMFEQKTIRTVTESWTGTYLMGWHAYLELFAPGGSEGLTEGSSGIGFSTLRLGSGGAIKRKLDSLPGEKTLSDLSRKVEGKDSIPWFDSIRLQSLDKGAFSAWLMDFRSDYIKFRKIELTKEGLFDRHGYNASLYTTSEQKKAFESRLFNDLSEVYLELDASESVSFDGFVTALGYSVSEDRGKQAYHAGTFTFFVSTLPNPTYRVCKVVCTLTRAVEPRAEYRFGPEKASSSKKEGFYETYCYCILHGYLVQNQDRNKRSWKSGLENGPMKERPRLLLSDLQGSLLGWQQSDPS